MLGFALDVVQNGLGEKRITRQKILYALFVVLRSWRNGVVVVLENTLFIAKNVARK